MSDLEPAPTRLPMPEDFREFARMYGRIAGGAELLGEYAAGQSAEKESLATRAADSLEVALLVARLLMDDWTLVHHDGVLWWADGGSDVLLREATRDEVQVFDFVVDLEVS